MIGALKKKGSLSKSSILGNYRHMSMTQRLNSPIFYDNMNHRLGRFAKAVGKFLKGLTQGWF